MKPIPLLILTILTGHLSATTASPATPRPNILVIVADDLGWGDVGFHKGNIPTPHLDRLAKDGLELLQFHTYPVCSPTRAALLTGVMPRRFGIADVVGPEQNLPDNIVTLPATLHSAGYKTSLIGKWHLGKTGTPQKHGFDHFYGFLGPQIDYFQHTDNRGMADWQRDGKPFTEEGYSTQLFAKEAVRQIQQRDPKHPFFIEVAFNAVHIPNGAPDDIIAKYKNLSQRDATFAAMVETLDTAIGSILDTIDGQGLRDSTLVLFFSDNGSGGRNGGSNSPLRGGKGTMFEGGIRTPCLLRWPGKIHPGSSSSQILSVHDLFPTLTAAASVSTDASFKPDGISVWEELRSGSVKKRNPVLIAGTDCAVLDQEWKLIETSDGKRSLFHLSKDPEEKKDLIGTEPAVALRLAETLTKHKQDLPAVRARPRPGMKLQNRPGGLQRNNTR